MYEIRDIVKIFQAEIDHLTKYIIHFILFTDLYIKIICMYNNLIPLNASIVQNLVICTFKHNPNHIVICLVLTNSRTIV